MEKEEKLRLGEEMVRSPLERVLAILTRFDCDSDQRWRCVLALNILLLMASSHFQTLTPIQFKKNKKEERILLQSQKKTNKNSFYCRWVSDFRGQIENLIWIHSGGDVWDCPLLLRLLLPLLSSRRSGIGILGLGFEEMVSQGGGTVATAMFFLREAFWFFQFRAVSVLLYSGRWESEKWELTCPLGLEWGPTLVKATGSPAWHFAVSTFG